MVQAEAVARYFLHLAVLSEEPEFVTHLKLQKLLYYAQGWSLGMRGRRLFKGTMQAWTHGPVVAEVYPAFADYGSMPIAAKESLNHESLTREDRGLVESIWIEYGGFTASRLREMTHAESPWRQAKSKHALGGTHRTEISDRVLQEHFGELHRKRCKRAGIDPEQLERAEEDVRMGRGKTFAEIDAELKADRTGRAA